MQDQYRLKLIVSGISTVVIPGTGPDSSDSTSAHLCARLSHVQKRQVIIQANKCDYQVPPVAAVKTNFVISIYDNELYVVTVSRR